MAILLDEGTPVFVAAPFSSRGYRVIHHADILERGAKDDLVAAMAFLNNAILIALDLDRKRLVRRFGAPVSNERYSSLNLIFAGCNRILAPKRIEPAMSFIENEWSVAREKRARRLWLDVSAHRLTTYR
jgi:hypothetical protein